MNRFADDFLVFLKDLLIYKSSSLNSLETVEKKNIFDNDDNNIINELYMLKFIFKNIKKFRIDFLDYL